MTLPRLFVIALFAVCPGLTAHAGGKKGEKTGISFHIQTEPTDNPKMIFPQLTNGQQLYYSRTPAIETRDVVAFNPFPSQDGEGFGVLLQLKDSAKNRFAAMSNSSINRWMVARINGRVVDAVIIDKQVDDGYLVIWKGIGAAEIEAFDAKVPRIGEKKPRR